MFDIAAESIEIIEDIHSKNYCTRAIYVKRELAYMLIGEGESTSHVLRSLYSARPNSKSLNTHIITTHEIYQRWYIDLLLPAVSLAGIMMILCSEVFFFAIVIDNHRTGEADMNRAHPSLVEKKRSFTGTGVKQDSGKGLMHASAEE